MGSATSVFVPQHHPTVTKQNNSDQAKVNAITHKIQDRNIFVPSVPNLNCADPSTRGLINETLRRANLATNMLTEDLAHITYKGYLKTFAETSNIQATIKVGSATKVINLNIGLNHLEQTNIGGDLSNKGVANSIAKLINAKSVNITNESASKKAYLNDPAIENAIRWALKTVSPGLTVDELPYIGFPQQITAPLIEGTKRTVNAIITAGTGLNAYQVVVPIYVTVANNPLQQAKAIVEMINQRNIVIPQQYKNTNTPGAWGAIQTALKSLNANIQRWENIITILPPLKQVNLNNSSLVNTRVKVGNSYIPMPIKVTRATSQIDQIYALKQKIINNKITVPASTDFDTSTPSVRRALLQQLQKANPNLTGSPGNRTNAPSGDLSHISFAGFLKPFPNSYSIHAIIKFANYQLSFNIRVKRD